MRRSIRFVLLGLMGLGVFACSSAPNQQTKSDETAKAVSAPVKAPAPDLGPTFEVKYSVMAEVLHMAEGISMWRQGMSKVLYREFDDRFGFDEADKQLRKRFAFVRNDLWERSYKRKGKISFAKPFGSEGLFPEAEPNLEAKLWLAAVAAPEPAALRRSMDGIVEPSDAEAVAGFLGQIAPRVGEMISESGGYREQAEQLATLLSTGKLPELLDRLGKFCGVNTRDLKFKVHPVWLPVGTHGLARAFGDTIVLMLPSEQAIGPTQVAQVVSAAFERILARVDERTKVLATNRFVEKAGFKGRPLPLVTALLDAAGYGLAAPLVAESPADVPDWPGDDARKRSAEAMTKVLRDFLAKDKKLDGLFALKGAKAHLKANPARPSDYVDGAMVIAHDSVLKPFKQKVTRWAVWKFPIDMKFNYPRKFDYSPGRSVLMILTPKDLKILPARFASRKKIAAALAQAAKALKTSKGAILTLPRESRGYVFVVAAAGPEAMQRVAKSFFELEQIPKEIVLVD